MNTQTISPLGWAVVYVGIPYLDYGRTKEGADCWGLCRMIWRELAGLELPEYAIDPNRGDLTSIAMAEEIKDWFPIDPGSEKPLDGVLMSGCYGTGRNVRRAAMHCGVVMMPGLLIHSTEETGAAVVARYQESRFSHDIVGFYRHRNLIGQ